MNLASSVALAGSAAQSSSAALSKEGLSCVCWCPSFAEVSTIAEALNVRGAGTGRAGTAAKPAKTHSASKCWFHLYQGSYPNCGNLTGPTGYAGELWGKDAKQRLRKDSGWDIFVHLSLRRSPWSAPSVCTNPAWEVLPGTILRTR